MHTGTHTVEYDSAKKKTGIVPFPTTQMDLEGIRLSEITQTITPHLKVGSPNQNKTDNAAHR